LGAAVADAGGRSSDVPARPAASAGTRRDNTAAPALVATGPHSMFR
jgi:hypothetical protein